MLLIRGSVTHYRRRCTCGGGWNVTWRRPNPLLTLAGVRVSAGGLGDVGWLVLPPGWASLSFAVIFAFATLAAAREGRSVANMLCRSRSGTPAIPGLLTA